jgi:hypothetical protein
MRFDPQLYHEGQQNPGMVEESQLVVDRAITMFQSNVTEEKPR